MAIDPAPLQSQSFATYWRRPWLVLASLLALTLLAFLLRLPKPRAEPTLVASDGVGYYSHLRSLVIDGDLDFTDEWAYYRVTEGYREITPLGRVANKYAIGAAILWAPFFLAAHAVALLAQASGLPIVPNGYGYVYEGAVSIGTILYGWLGFVLAYACARRTFTSAPIISAVVVLWLASNAWYYMIFEPSMAHMVALFAVALALSVWLAYFYGAAAPSLRHALALGLASGLVLLVRLQDAPLLLLPYAHAAIRAVHAHRQGDTNAARRWLVSAALAGAVAMLCFVPQLIVWQVLYGTWTHSPYAVEHDPPFYWAAPRLGAVLFSPFHGLFTWHPVYFFAGGGLLALGRKDRTLALGLAAILAVETYVIASWWNWWQGAAFGGRMFLSAMWIWVWGLAGFFDWIRRYRRLVPLVAGIALLLILWNGLALVQYRLLLIPADQPVTWHQLTIDRITLLGPLLGRLLAWL